jgi:hypothetical protein
MKYIIPEKLDALAEWIFTRIYWWCRLSIDQSHEINSDVISGGGLYFTACSGNQVDVTKRMVLSRVDRNPVSGNLAARKRKAGRIGLAIEGR